MVNPAFTTPPEVESVKPPSLASITEFANAWTNSSIEPAMTPVMQPPSVTTLPPIIDGMNTA